MSKHPSVFISYSHDSQSHKNWVLALATKLRENGVDVILDQWNLHPGDDLAVFMEKGVRDCGRVLLVCSSEYVEKANAGKDGVGYEKMIVNVELVGDVGTKKFIPIIRNSDEMKTLPTFLGGRVYVDFDDDERFEDNFTLLLRELHSQELLPKPPIGQSPFSVSSAPEDVFESQGADAAGSVRPMSPKGLDLDWIDTQYQKANQNLTETGLTAFMEVVFAIDGTKPRLDQKLLLEAARTSQIETFGWPIGLVAPSGHEYGPKPLADGVFAQIAIDSERRESYDYWMLRTNADYYLLKSLFEDTRKADTIFFNTRIVRNTEALLFCSNLYSNLGVDESSIVVLRITYGGLAGRAIDTSTAMRERFPARRRETSENLIATAVTVPLKDIKPEIVRLVIEVTDPLFTMFDFLEVSDKVYKQIVEDFIRGKVT